MFKFKIKEDLTSIIYIDIINSLTKYYFYKGKQLFNISQKISKAIVNKGVIRKKDE